MHRKGAPPALREELAHPGGREAPEVAMGVRRAHAAERRRGGEQDAASPQGAKAVVDAVVRSAEKTRRLGEDDAVVRLWRQGAHLLEVCDERHARVAGVDVDDDTLGDPIGTESCGVGVVLNFEHPPMDRVATRIQNASMYRLSTGVPRSKPYWSLRGSRGRSANAPTAPVSPDPV